MAVEVWLTEKYCREFQERKNVLFSYDEAIRVYQRTQFLQKRWPEILNTPVKWLGNRYGLFYLKSDGFTCRLRICFGVERFNGVDRIVALTCRSKQELSKGSSDGTKEWYRHMATVGVDEWDSYRRGLVNSWKIYP